MLRFEKCPICGHEHHLLITCKQADDQIRDYKAYLNSAFKAGVLSEDDLKRFDRMTEKEMASRIEGMSSSEGGRR